MSDETHIKLGACCACGKPGPTVRTIMMLHKPAPVKGKGWGCLVCHLPSDGAVAVLCDACVDAKRPIVVVCLGYPSSGQRVSIETLSGTFEHNPAMHADD